MKLMKQRKCITALFLTMVMLLSFSIVPGALAYDESGPPILTDQNHDALREMLAQGDVILQTEDGKNLGIPSDSPPLVIPVGKTLFLRTPLNVGSSGAELIIEGTLVVEAGGRLNSQGSQSTINVAQGGVLVNYGHVENVTSSVLINNGTIINNALFEVRAGVTFFDNGTLIANAPANIHYHAVRIDSYLAQTLTVQNHNTLRDMLAVGDVILHVPSYNNLGVASVHEPLVVPEGRTLILRSPLNVGRGAELIIYGTVLVARPSGRLNNQGNGSTIIIAEGGRLINNRHVENVTGSVFINDGVLVNHERFEVRAGVEFQQGRTEGVALNVNQNAIVR